MGTPFWHLMIAMTLIASFKSLSAENSTALEIHDNDMKNTEQILSRRKRYIVFPKGSSLQLVFCYTLLVQDTIRYKIGQTAGLAWMLPDDPNYLTKKKHKRFKRDVISKVESFMNAQNLNGKECILRALCESRQRTTKLKPFIFEILHKIFHVDDESELDDSYHKAYSSINSDCSTLYKQCTFSLFDMQFTHV